VVGAWAALYSTGFTKPEVIKHTFVHHTYDACFYRAVPTGTTLQTNVVLTGVGPHRPRGGGTTPSGARFTTAFTTHEADSGVLVGDSWWGGVVLGLPPLNNHAAMLAGRAQPPKRPPAPPPPPLLSPPLYPASTSVMVAAGLAHLFDSCIRDPRQPKAASSDINPHTNMQYAAAAGLGGRTLNGMCLLAYVLPSVHEAAVAAVDVGWVLDAGKVKGGGCSSSTELVRIGCTFSAPVQLHFEPVALTLTILAVRVLPPIAPAHTTDGSPIAASIEARTVAVHFQVHSATGSRALKEGYAEWVVTQSTRSSSPLARTSKL
jgi:acyl dehydratase